MGSVRGVKILSALHQALGTMEQVLLETISGHVKEDSFMETVSITCEE